MKQALETPIREAIEEWQEIELEEDNFAGTAAKLAAMVAMSTDRLGLREAPGAYLTGSDAKQGGRIHCPEAFFQINGTSRTRDRPAASPASTSTCAGLGICSESGKGMRVRPHLSASR